MSLWSWASSELRRTSIRRMPSPYWHRAVVSPLILFASFHGPLLHGDDMVCRCRWEQVTRCGRIHRPPLRRPALLPCPQPRHCRWRLRQQGGIGTDADKEVVSVLSTFPLFCSLCDGLWLMYVYSPVFHSLWLGFSARLLATVADGEHYYGLLHGGGVWACRWCSFRLVWMPVLGICCIYGFPGSSLSLWWPGKVYFS